MNKFLFSFLLILVILISACTKQNPIIDRESKIPKEAIKMTPETDNLPPILHSDEYEQPIPFAIVNTAGGEDSPFMPESNDEFYFFFTPDVSVPVEKQVLDQVTGMYVSKKVNNAFQKPERVWLQKPGKLSLDGCQFVQDNKMLFCTVREGYTGIHWFAAERKNNKWTNWKESDFDPGFDVGELHIHKNELYYHSDREGSKGGLDIWKITKIDGQWQNPINVEIVNSEENEGWPYITPDGNELWFNRRYFGSPAVFRSKKINNQWQEPELIVSQFAAEPTLDSKGNVFFVHHYYENGTMIESDIYVAYKK
jgi:hypothetical protein